MLSWGAFEIKWTLRDNPWSKHSSGSGKLKNIPLHFTCIYIVLVRMLQMVSFVFTEKSKQISCFLTIKNELSSTNGCCKLVFTQTTGSINAVIMIKLYKKNQNHRCRYQAGILIYQSVKLIGFVSRCAPCNPEYWSAWCIKIYPDYHVNIK